MKTKDKKAPDFLTILSLFELLHVYWQQRASRSELEKKRAVLQKQVNRAGTLRTVFGLFNWQYMLLPIGICNVYRKMQNGDYTGLLRARELYFFGFRIARWVVEDHILYEPLTVPRTKRERIADRHRKKFRSYRRDT